MNLSVLLQLFGQYIISDMPLIHLTAMYRLASECPCILRFKSARLSKLTDDCVIFWLLPTAGLKKKNGVRGKRVMT